MIAPTIAATRKPPRAGLIAAADAAEEAEDAGDERERRRTATTGVRVASSAIALVATASPSARQPWWSDVEAQHDADADADQRPDDERGPDAASRSRRARRGASRAAMSRSSRNPSRTPQPMDPKSHSPRNRKPPMNSSIAASSRIPSAPAPRATIRLTSSTISPISVLARLTCALNSRLTASNVAPSWVRRPGGSPAAALLAGVAGPGLVLAPSSSTAPPGGCWDRARW